MGRAPYLRRTSEGLPARAASHAWRIVRLVSAESVLKTTCRYLGIEPEPPIRPRAKPTFAHLIEEHSLPFSRSEAGGKPAHRPIRPSGQTARIMKPQLLRRTSPPSLGLVLLTLLLGVLPMTLLGCEAEEGTTTCKTGSCLGSDDKCYGPCSAGYSCTTTPSGTCSDPSAGGVYCCGSSSGGGCTPTGCASSTPWLCGGHCYATPPSGNHSCIKCP
jgi:hypothetical protein